VNNDLGRQGKWAGSNFFYCPDIYLPEGHIRDLLSLSFCLSFFGGDWIFACAVVKSVQAAMLGVPCLDVFEIVLFFTYCFKTFSTLTRQ